jgi:hypothetical protein
VRKFLQWSAGRNQEREWVWEFMLAIPATGEVAIERMVVSGQLRQKHQDPTSKNNLCMVGPIYNQKAKRAGM